MKNIRYSLLLLLSSLSLLSYSQKDTTDYGIKSWEVNSFLENFKCPQDTFLQAFHLYNPIHRKGYSYSFLGNTGQPYQNNYLLNRKAHDFLFLSPYYDYLFLPENAQFYNTKQQYTDFRYITNFAKKNNLQNVDLLHTQNILPNLNFGIQYRLLGALGEYQAQKTSDHFFRFFSSYQQKNYQAFLTYHYNKINNLLNGGLISDTLINNPNYEISDTKFIPVNLETSKSKILNRNINLKQSFSFKEQGISKQDTTPYKKALMRWRIGHELDLSYNKRIYTNTGSSGFYQTCYIDTGAILGNSMSDSTGYQSLKNTFFIQLLDDSLSQALPSVILGYSLKSNIYQSYNQKNKENRHWVHLKISNPIFKEWYWSINNYYDLKLSDFKTDALIAYNWGKKQKQKIDLQAYIEKKTPNLFYRHYLSHFYKWNNTFKHTEEKHIDLNYNNKKLKLKIGINQTYYKNYIYIGSKIDNVWKNDSTITTDRVYGIPMQHKKSFGIFSIYTRHQIDWGAFHTQNAFVYQKISKSYPINLPQFQWYNSTYFQMRFFKKVMTLQLGFDIRINSSYNIDGFIPATGLFYTQNKKTVASYPYVDIFVNVKIKKLRLFLKLEHSNEGLTGNHYYTTLYHPMNPRVIRFGLSWRFYN